jgi:pimeloyl-ACP methyl ester carboxylesterase
MRDSLTKNVTRANCGALLVLLAIVTASCTQRIEADVIEPKVVRGLDRGYCAYNKIHVSPNGELVAVSNKEQTFGEARDFNVPEGFIVAELNNPGEVNSVNSNGVFIFAPPSKDDPPRLIPLGWSNETLLFRIGSRHVGRAQLDSQEDQWKTKMEDLSNVWGAFNVEVTGQNDLQALRNSSVIQRAAEIARDDHLRRRTVYLLPGAVKFSALDLFDRQILRLGDNLDGMVSLGPASFFWRFTVGLEGGKANHYFLGERWFGHIGRAAYRLPLMDQRTGAVVGYFSPDSIDNPESSYLMEVIASGGYLINDAAVIGKRTFVLVENDKGISLLASPESKEGAVRQTLICTKENPLNPFSQALGIDSSKINAPSEKSEKRPVFGIELHPDIPTTGVLYQATRASEKRLVLYYHGGPTGSNYGSALPRPLRNLRNRGFDVLSVEYSGSVGGGLELSNALATEPTFGFDQDAQAVRYWIEKVIYDEVVLYAVSFGAVPAMVFQHSNNSIVDRSVYLGPLLELPEPAVSERAGGRLFESEEGSHKHFDEGVFGSIDGREKFRAWLRAMAKNFDASEDDLFIFGELDQKTPFRSASSNITNEGKILVVPNTAHQFLGSQDKIGNVIFEHLSETR